MNMRILIPGLLTASLLLAACQESTVVTHSTETTSTTESSTATVSTTTTPSEGSPASTTATTSTTATAEPATVVPALTGGQRLLPVDEGPQSASFLSFRTSLQEAVRKRDIEGVISRVDPNIRTSFGAGGGRDAFRKLLAAEKSESPVWKELETVLGMGGSFIDKEKTAFFAPYVYSKWPDEADAFESLVAVCPSTIVRERASSEAAAITRLDGHIVTIGKDDPIRKGEKNPEWRQIVLPDGRTAWGEASCLRSSIGYRAGFNEKNGKWTMTAFVAGD